MGRELRERKKLTQQELGNLVNVSWQSIAAIEKGKYDPTVWLAYDLARVFCISISTADRDEFISAVCGKNQIFGSLEPCGWRKYKKP